MADFFSQTFEGLQVRLSRNPITPCQNASDAMPDFIAIYENSVQPFLGTRGVPGGTAADSRGFFANVVWGGARGPGRPTQAPKAAAALIVRAPGPAQDLVLHSKP